MWLLLLLYAMVRLTFTLCYVLLALFLTFAAALGVIIAGLVELRWPDRGGEWRQAASLVIHSAIKVAGFAQRRPWLVP